MKIVTLRTKLPELEFCSVTSQLLVKTGLLLFPQHKDLHLVLLVLSIMPTIPSLRHQQSDDVTLGKAEQCTVVTSSMRKDGLHTRAPVLLQSSRHGAGSGQSSCLS